MDTLDTLRRVIVTSIGGFAAAIAALIGLHALGVVQDNPVTTFNDLVHDVWNMLRPH